MRHHETMGDGGGALAQPRRVDPQLLVLIGVLVLIAVTPLVLWMVSVNQTSAGSVPMQSPVPATTLSASQIDLAATFRPYSNAVPVVSFVGIDPSGAGEKVTPSEFATQMAMLDQAGFSTITVDQVRAMVLGQPVDLPVNPILLTFDQVDPTLWSDVDPVLAAHGFTATAFLTVADVTDPVRLETMNLDTLKAMKDSRRWGFGVHMEASSLSRSGELQAAWEAKVRSSLSEGRAAVESALGVRAISMSYPFGEQGMPGVDAGGMQRLPELVGEQFDLGFLDTDRSVVVTASIDKSMAPRLPRGRTSLSPEGLLGAIEDVLPRPPSGSLDAIAWAVVGEGSCDSSNHTLIISAEQSTSCRLESSVTEVWDDVSISGLVDGISAGTIATYRMRERALDRIEVALAVDRVIVQRQSTGSWSQIVSVDLPPDGSGVPRAVMIQLRGSKLRVTLDGAVVVDAEVGASTGAGSVSLGATVDQASVVTMTELSVTAPNPA